MTFSVGSVLGKSFGIWFKNLIPFTLLAAAVHFPLIVYTYFAMSSLETGDFQHNWLIWSSVNTVASMVLNNIVSGAIIYGVVQELRGAHASMGESLGMGIRRLLPVLGVGILVSLCILGGAILLIVPGVIFACMLFVAVPAAVCEQPGLFGALRRSRALTDGFKVPIFGMLFLIGVVNGVVGYLMQKVIVTSIDGLKAYAYVALAIDAVFGALNAVIAGVTYATLRREREGTDTEELARVFT